MSTRHRVKYNYLTSSKYVVPNIKCVKKMWFSSIWWRNDEIGADVVFSEKMINIDFKK